MKVICGIYMICSNKSNKVYIGSSKHILKRYREHMSKLSKRTHHNYKLQEHYDSYLPSWSVKVLEECEEHQLSEREQYWLLHYNAVRNGFNVCYDTSRRYNPLRGKYKLV